MYDIIKKNTTKEGEDAMEEKSKEQNRKCFIITPIGDETSETFRMAKGVIESVIKPLLQENGYDDIKPAYEINQSGMITTQIINRILDDDLVIANLTGNNPNVMYELCLRHVTTRPIIHICQNGTILPFDIKDNRTIFYTNDMLGVQELKEQMVAFLQEIDYTKENLDNPIYNAQRIGKLLKKVPEESEKKVEIELLQSILNTLNSSQFNRDVINTQLTVYKWLFNIQVKGDKEKIHAAQLELRRRMKVFGFQEKRSTENSETITIMYEVLSDDFKLLNIKAKEIFKDVCEKFSVDIKILD